ncbi:MAG: hypothetical protein EOO24_36665 [Comamonadaceae bacterium]|nr:MAG: hypothetical protein EOO24_36665 [Comamonadaceae bacterium]
MHTAICTFKDHATARQAMDRLAAAGIARHDMHLEHRTVDGELNATGEGAARRDKPAPNDNWDGLEREVAVDRSVLSSFGHFFASLLGQDNPSGYTDTYSQHVERGSVVLVVDADDETQARRASQLLNEAQASDMNLVHRPQQRPLRDIVGERQASGLERSFGTARGDLAQGVRGRQDSVEEDRAMAAARAGDKPGLEDGDRPGVKLKNMGRSDGL